MEYGRDREQVKKERKYWRKIRKDMKTSGRSFDGYKHTYRGGLLDSVSRFFDKLFGK